MAEGPDALLQLLLRVAAGALDVRKAKPGQYQKNHQHNARKREERNLQLADADLLHRKTAEHYARNEVRRHRGTHRVCRTAYSHSLHGLRAFYVTCAQIRVDYNLEDGGRRAHYERTQQENDESHGDDGSSNVPGASGETHCVPGRCEEKKQPCQHNDDAAQKGALVSVAVYPARAHGAGERVSKEPREGDERCECVLETSGVCKESLLERRLELGVCRSEEPHYEEQEHQGDERTQIIGLVLLHRLQLRCGLFVKQDQAGRVQLEHRRRHVLRDGTLYHFLDY